MQLGQWLTRDPFWPLLRSFVYCGGAPIWRSDPVGLKSRISQGPHGDLPHFGFEHDTAMHYGMYCGSKTRHENCAQPEPLDCIDRACSDHDDCLTSAMADDPSMYFVSHEGAKCHCALAIRARYCGLVGCMIDGIKQGSLTRYTGCSQASAAVDIVFSNICGVTLLLGFGVPAPVKK